MQADAAQAAQMSQRKIDEKVAALKATLAVTGMTLTNSQAAAVTEHFESQTKWEENSAQQPLEIDIAAAAAKALTLTISQTPNVPSRYALTLV